MSGSRTEMIETTPQEDPDDDDSDENVLLENPSKETQTEVQEDSEEKETKEKIAWGKVSKEKETATPGNAEEDEAEVASGKSSKTAQTDGDLEDENEESKGKKFAKDAGWFLLKTGLISAAVIGGTTVGLTVIGFGALGPTAGSLAAWYQSSVLGGTIASGSAFATLQSVGMVGLSAAAKVGVVAGSGGASAATSVIGKMWKKAEKNQKTFNAERKNEEEQETPKCEVKICSNSETQNHSV